MHSCFNLIFSRKSNFDELDNYVEKYLKKNKPQKLQSLSEFGGFSRIQNVATQLLSQQSEDPSTQEKVKSSFATIQEYKPLSEEEMIKRIWECNSPQDLNDLITFYFFFGGSLKSLTQSFEVKMKNCSDSTEKFNNRLVLAKAIAIYEELFVTGCPKINPLLWQRISFFVTNLSFVQKLVQESDLTFAKRVQSDDIGKVDEDDVISSLGFLETKRGSIEDYIEIILPLAKTKSKDRRLFHFACRYGNLEDVKTLVENGCDVNLCFDPSDEYCTPLSEALMKEDNLPVIACLLQKGANVNHPLDKDGETPLSRALKRQNLPLIELLFKANINQVDREGYTLVHHVCQLESDPENTQEMRSIISLMINHGADFTIQSTSEWTPLELAMVNKSKMGILILRELFKNDPTLMQALNDPEDPIEKFKNLIDQLFADEALLESTVGLKRALELSLLFNMDSLAKNFEKKMASSEWKFDRTDIKILQGLKQNDIHTMEEALQPFVRSGEIKRIEKVAKKLLSVNGSPIQHSVIKRNLANVQLKSRTSNSDYLDAVIADNLIRNDTNQLTQIAKFVGSSRIQNVAKLVLLQRTEDLSIQNNIRSFLKSLENHEPLSEEQMLNNIWVFQQIRNVAKTDTLIALYMSCGGSLQNLTTFCQEKIESAAATTMDKFNSHAVLAKAIAFQENLFIKGRSTIKPPVWQRIAFFVANLPFVQKYIQESDFAFAKRVQSEEIKKLSPREIGFILNLLNSGSSTIMYYLELISPLARNGVKDNRLYFWACRYGDPEDVKALVEKDCDVNASLNGRDPHFNPLSQALLNKNNVSVVECLLQKRATVDQPVNAKGATALSVAVSKQDLPLVKLLLQNKANVNQSDIFQSTPVHYLCRLDFDPDKAQEIQSMISLFINHGADFTITNNAGWSPLELALQNNTKVGILILRELFKNDRCFMEALNSPENPIEKFMSLKNTLFNDDKLLVQTVGLKRACELSVLFGKHYHALKFEELLTKTWKFDKFDETIQRSLKIQKVEDAEKALLPFVQLGEIKRIQKIARKLLSLNHSPVLHSFIKRNLAKVQETTALTKTEMADQILTGGEQDIKSLVSLYLQFNGSLQPLCEVLQQKIASSDNLDTSYQLCSRFSYVMRQTEEMYVLGAYDLKPTLWQRISFALGSFFNQSDLASAKAVQDACLKSMQEQDPSFLSDKLKVALNSNKEFWMLEPLVLHGAKVEDAQKEKLFEIACHTAQLDLVKHLVEVEEMDPNLNFETAPLETPLAWVFASYRYEPLIRYLLENKANAKVPCNGDWHRLAHVYYAQFPSSEKLVKLLLSYGADVNAPANELLLKTRPARGSSEEDDGTALHYAAQMGSSSMVKTLLQQPNIQIDPIDFLQETPAHAACRGGFFTSREPNEDLRVLRLLIAHNADLSKINYLGKTPARLAWDRKRIHLLREIFKNCKPLANALKDRNDPLLTFANLIAAYKANPELLIHEVGEEAAQHTFNLLGISALVAIKQKNVDVLRTIFEDCEPLKRALMTNDNPLQAFLDLVETYKANSNLLENEIGLPATKRVFELLDLSAILAIQHRDIYEIKENFSFCPPLLKALKDNRNPLQAFTDLVEDYKVHPDKLVQEVGYDIANRAFALLGIEGNPS